MSAFQPTQTLASADGGAKSHRYVQVRPDSAATGANFVGTISFSYKPAAGEFIDFDRSYLSVRSTWDNNAGPPAPLVGGDNIAMARFGFVNAFSTMSTYLGDTLVERTDFPAQAAIVQHALSKTSAWAESAGSAYVAQQTFASRQAYVIGGVSYDTRFKPPQGVWSTSHLVRASPMRFEASVHPDWDRRVAESVSGSKAPGADYNVVVNEVLLWLSVWTPEPGSAPTKISSDILDCVAMRVQSTQLAATTSTQLSFGVESSTYTLVNLFQRSDQGYDTLYAVSTTETADVQAIAVDWQGVRSPQIPWNGDFSSGAGLIRIYDEGYLEVSVGSSSDAGVFLDLADWEDSPLFATKLIGSASTYDDRVNVSIDTRSAFSGVLYTLSLYPSRIVLMYGPDGMVSRVSVAKTAAELAALASSMSA